MDHAATETLLHTKEEKLPLKDSIFVDVEKQCHPVSRMKFWTGRRFLVSSAVASILTAVTLCLSFVPEMTGIWGPRFPSFPQPEIVEMHRTLGKVIGQSLQEYYSKHSAGKIGVLCPSCIEAEAQKLLAASTEQLSKFCTEDSKSLFKDKFCKFAERFPNITVLAVFSKAEVNFLTLALSSCAAIGSCSTEANNSMDSNSDHDLRKMQHTVGSKLAEHEKEPAWMEVHFSAGNSSNPCLDCFAHGFELDKWRVEHRLKHTCNDPRAPPHVQAACAFIDKYPFLSKTALLLREKPWHRVLGRCAARGLCRPPHPPHRGLHGPHCPDGPRGHTEEADPQDKGGRQFSAFLLPSLHQEDMFGPAGPPPGPPVLCWLTFGLACPPPPPF